MGISHLKTYPNLNAKIIADKLSMLYRIWLIARKVNEITNQGSGILGKEVFFGALEGLGLNKDHWRTTQAHPKASLFFIDQGDTLELRSLSKLCQSLGVAPGRSSVPIDVGCVARKKDFLANLYAAWFTEGRRISREKLTAIFGVSSETQRRWEQIAAIDVQYNIVKVDKAIFENEKVANNIPRDKRLDERLDRAYTWEDDKNVYYQTVNSYQAAKLHRGRVGNTRKIGKLVRAAEGVEFCEDATQQNDRVFYSAENVPQNYQEVPGVCLRDTGQVQPSRCGEAQLWQLSITRPVPRKVALR